MNSDIYIVVEHLRGALSGISYVMAAAGQMAHERGGQSVAILLHHGAADLVQDLAVDSVLEIDHPALCDFSPDASLATLAAVLPPAQPRLVLLGDTSIGAEVAGGLSARLGWPLLSGVRRLHLEPDQIRFSSVLCGGRVLAEGDVPGPTALVAMVPGGYRIEAGRATQPAPVRALEPPNLEELRVTHIRYLEPTSEDVDLTQQSILVSAGRGIQRQENLALIEALAAALGGTVCASRPLVDQGWLPTTRLVGKSGKSVRPKVYLALGISGAPEHVEGMSESELIIAVNTDPAAPIFDVADYGAELDLLDLVPVLTEAIRTAKG